MKEDILEQLVEDWLQAQGYFTRTNQKFAPKKGVPGYVGRLHGNGSDMDVIGIHPGKTGPERVMVVNCKSWQDGFDIAVTAHRLNNESDLTESGKELWKHFRELVKPIWTDAFLETLQDVAHCGDEFTYVTAVTWACDPEHKDHWENNPNFKAALKGNPIRFLTLRDMLDHVFSKLGTTVESSQFSRTLQLLKAAKIDLSLKPAAPIAKAPSKAS
jgi:hypothetical protein